jgi:hypothetical protein
MVSSIDQRMHERRNDCLEWKRRTHRISLQGVDETEKLALPSRLRRHNGRGSIGSDDERGVDEEKRETCSD